MRNYRKKTVDKRMTDSTKKIMSIMLCALIGYFLIHMGYVNFIVGDNVTDPIDLAYIHFIDVGQGDSTIIQGKDFNILIDGGQNSKKLLEYIERSKIEYFDYVIATHPHSDHIGGLIDVINKYEIENFIMPNAVHTTKDYEDLLIALENTDTKVTIPTVGDIFGSNDINITVIGPNSSSYEDLNNYSISLKVKCGNVSLLFAGDAEALAEREMIDSQIDLSADIYKVSHHGSNSSTTAEFLDKISPTYAVISCGTGNKYGHPHKEVLDRLYGINVQILRTDVDGNILMYTDGTNITSIKNY